MYQVEENEKDLLELRECEKNSLRQKLKFYALILGGVLASLMVVSYFLFEHYRCLDWGSIGKVADYIPKGGKAKKLLHHGSMWKYLNNDQWDQFVLSGLGYQGRNMLATGKDLKIFEVGSGTGAALSTLVRKYPSVKEVYGLEPAQAPVSVCEKYFAQEHAGKLHSPNGGSKIIMGFANTKTMGGLPGKYYDQVMANGVLCYVPSIENLKEIISELMRILKPDGIFSATLLFDNKKHSLGYRYGSIQLAISQKHFWEALQAELGYTIIAVDYMGTWDGFHGQRSRYAIQLRKNKMAGTGKKTDLSKAVSDASCCSMREYFGYLKWPIVIVLVLVALGLLA